MPAMSAHCYTPSTPWEEPCHATRPTSKHLGSAGWPLLIRPPAVALRSSSILLSLFFSCIHPRFPSLGSFGDNHLEPHSHISVFPLSCLLSGGDFFFFLNKHCRCMTELLPLRPNRIHIASRGVPTELPHPPAVESAPLLTHSSLTHPAEPTTRRHFPRISPVFSLLNTHSEGIF